MKTKLALIAACLALVLPPAVSAATIDASQIPDGTYTVTVEKVVDPQHIQVTLDNGSDTTLAAGRATVNFSKVQPHDQLKMSIIKGAVVVYIDLTTHS